MNGYHQSVLLKEVLSLLEVSEGKEYIDATAGDGGHTLGIASNGGHVLAIDQDEHAVVRFQQRLKREPSAVSSRIKIVLGRFAMIDKIAQKEGLPKVDGILFDLGTSQYQLKNSHRGLSFQQDDYLDMRLHPEALHTAFDLLHQLSEDELDWLFTRYGEEPLAKEIAKMIIQKRNQRNIRTSGDLATLVQSVYHIELSGKRGKIHPATRVFQALRIAVNEELTQLSASLKACLNILKSGGIVAVITFHSLEDRIVKQFMRRKKNYRVLTAQPVFPSREEIQKNPSVRSAKLRAMRYEP